MNERYTQAPALEIIRQLAAIRNTQGRSQNDIGRAINHSRESIGDIENGRKEVKLRDASNIAVALGYELALVKRSERIDIRDMTMRDMENMIARLRTTIEVLRNKLDEKDGGQRQRESDGV